jgi:hypothetical protein
VSFYDIRFEYRVGFLLVLLGTVALIDFVRKRAEATKWREYGFLVLCGTGGAVLGALNDWVTSSISPYYFILGKGLAGGEGIRWRAAILGSHAGFFAGAIVAAAYLYTNNPKPRRRRLTYRRLFVQLWKPAVGAALFGCLIPLCCRSLDPLGYGRMLDGGIEDSDIRWFVMVWWIHTGLYLGLAVGTVWGALTIRQQRKGQSASSA